MIYRETRSRRLMSFYKMDIHFTRMDIYKKSVTEEKPGGHFEWNIHKETRGQLRSSINKELFSFVNQTRDQGSSNAIL